MWLQGVHALSELAAMTKGLLIIRAQGERKRVVLCTHHSAYLIPRTVEKAVDVLVACHAYYFKHVPSSFSPEMLARDVSNHGMLSDVDYPPKVAALVVAAEPEFLMPMPDSFLRSSHLYSGEKHACQLSINRHVWKLFIPEEGTTEIEVRKLFHTKLAKAARSAARAQKRARSRSHATES